MRYTQVHCSFLYDLNKDNIQFKVCSTVCFEQLSEVGFSYTPVCLFSDRSNLPCIYQLKGTSLDLNDEHHYTQIVPKYSQGTNTKSADLFT